MDLTKLTSSCVKCGKCIPSCTIYQSHRDETTSPRGFLDLVAAAQKGNLDLDKNAKNIFDSCFLCTTCVTNCPSSLDVPLAIESVRYDLAQKHGQSLFKRVYFFALRHRWFADFIFKTSAFLAPCAFKKDGEKLVLRFFGNFNGFGGIFKRAVFPFHKKSFLQKHGSAPFEQSEISHSKISESKKVAIFIGCISNYNYPNVGESLIQILNALNIEHFTPKAQECCGAPAFFSGDVRTTTHLIKKNIAYFETFWEQIDAMIIPEATCAAMIKKDWAHALELEGEKLKIDNSQWLARLEKLLPKVYMASAWLESQTHLADILADAASAGASVENLDSQTLDSESKPQITYHDPCHARKVLGIYKEPRRLLAQNFTIKEMGDSARCCGFGGISMQSEKYDLTLKAGLPKAHDIDSQNVEIVSAECGACRMQITNSLHQINSKTKFVHPLELIAQNLQNLDSQK